MEVLVLGWAEGGEAEVADDQQVDAGEGLEVATNMEAFTPMAP